MAQSPAQKANANVHMFHRMLGLGGTVFAIVVVVIRARMDPPSADDQFTSIVAYTLAGISLVLIAVAVMVLTRRVPERSISQSLDAYWTTAGVLPAANLFWLVVEGAASLAIVGYLVTGHLAPAAVMVVGLGVFWWVGPNMFSKP